MLDRKKLQYYRNERGSAILNIVVATIGLLLLIVAIGMVTAFAIDTFGGNGISLNLGGSPKDKIAVIYVEGQMVADKSPDERDTACSCDIVRCMRKATEDPNVKAIVLRVNSPGGTPVAAEEIISQINKTREVKPVIVSMGDIATSAAYFISSCADRIVANPDTFTGSIGVLWVFKNRTQYYSDEGINFYVAKSGNFKDLGSDWRGLSESEKDYVQKIINESYDRFVAYVCSGRNLSQEFVRKIADGRIITGSKAREMGLVDELGGLYDAVSVAKEMANVEGKVQIVHMNEPSLTSPAER